MQRDKRVLLAAGFTTRFEHDIDERFGAIGPPGGALEPFVRALSVEARAAIRAVVTIGSVPIGADLIALLPALGVICCRGSGYDGVDIAAVRARGIGVTHGADLNASSVADLAMGLLIASVRNMAVAREAIMQGAWRDDRIHSALRVRGLTGRRAGIYGLGAIGMRIAQRAAAFEMEVGYHNRHARPDVTYRYFGSLADLAHWAEVLIIAVRGGPATHHAVGASILTALGPTGFVVNIARGSVIDERALIEALASGTIAGAGLDVFEHEPDVDRALLCLPHVALTPHMGGDTEEAEAATLSMVLANLDAFFAGHPLLTPIPG